MQGTFENRAPDIDPIERMHPNENDRHKGGWQIGTAVKPEPIGWWKSRDCSPVSIQMAKWTGQSRSHNNPTKQR